MNPAHHRFRIYCELQDRAERRLENVQYRAHDLAEYWGHLSILRCLTSNALNTGEPQYPRMKEILQVIADFYEVEILVFRRVRDQEPDERARCETPGYTPPFELEVYGATLKTSATLDCPEPTWILPSSCGQLQPPCQVRNSLAQLQIFLTTDADYRHWMPVDIESVRRALVLGTHQIFDTDFVLSDRRHFPMPWWPSYVRSTPGLMEDAIGAASQAPAPYHPTNPHDPYALRHWHCRKVPGLNYAGPNPQSISALPPFLYSRFDVVQAVGGGQPIPVRPWDVDEPDLRCFLADQDLDYQNLDIQPVEIRDAWAGETAPHGVPDPPLAQDPNRKACAGPVVLEMDPPDGQAPAVIHPLFVNADHEKALDVCRVAYMADIVNTPWDSHNGKYLIRLNKAANSGIEEKYQYTNL
jgi:hypothetical protein